MKTIPNVGDIIYCVHPQFNYRVQKNTVVDVIREAEDVVLLHLSNGYLFGLSQVGLCLFYNKVEARARQEKIFNNIKD